MNLPFSSCFYAKLGIAIHKRKRETLSCVAHHAIHLLSSVFPRYISAVQIKQIVKVQ